MNEQSLELEGGTPKTGGAMLQVGTTRRRFLIATGITLATATTFGSVAQRVRASSGTVPGATPDGLSDTFGALANDRADVALAAFDQVSPSGTMNTLRFPLYWSEVETAEGYDWTPYEAVREQAIFHGLKPLPVVLDCPAPWLAAGEAETAGFGLSYPTGHGALNAFGRFVTETARFFSEYGGHVEAIEIWSEPNNFEGPGIRDPRDFARMLATASLHVAASADQSSSSAPVTIISGGLLIDADDVSWVNYLDGFSGQLYPYEIGLHIYPDRLGEQSDFGTINNSVADLIGYARSRVDTDVWVTELSAPPSTASVDQATVLTRAIEAAEASGCRGVIVGRLYPGGETELALGSAPAGSAIVADVGATSDSWDALRDHG